MLKGGGGSGAATATYISIDLAHHELFRAKVDKGGINTYIMLDICLYSPPKVISILKAGFQLTCIQM